MNHRSIEQQASMVLHLKCVQFKLNAQDFNLMEQLDPLSSRLYVTLTINNKQMKTRESALDPANSSSWSEEFTIKVNHPADKIIGKIWAVDAENLEQKIGKFEVVVGNLMAGLQNLCLPIFQK